MTGEGRRESAAAELDLADEEITVAAELIETGRPRIALARLYFAAFHAARARLFAEGIEPKTHAGVQHLFNVNFVATGAYDGGVLRLLARLQKYREQADYSRSFVVDVEGGRKEVAAVRDFLERVRREIGSSAGAD